MKKTNFWLILAATFVGVTAALQVDRFVSRAPAAKSTAELPLSNEVKFQPASYSTSTAVAGDFRNAAKKINPSVVSVDRYEMVRRGFYDDQGAMQETGTGSGVIVSADGVIVTNNHVVADERGQAVSQVKVRLSDKRTLTAKVLGTDPRADIAVLRVDAKNLTPIEMGTSTDLEVGQWVIAVGNPLGFDNTVSVGVVSSLKRDLPVGVGGLVNAIQTDAAINPGNSGGALCDIDGHLIGINSAIASQTGGSVGIGFAIPVDRVKDVVKQIVAKGYASYAGLGVHYDQRFIGAFNDPDFRAQLADQVKADENSVPKAGILVSQADGAAAAAGIKQFDVIESIGDTDIDTPFALNRALLPHKPGDKVAVKYWSHGTTKTVNVTLQEVH